MHIQRYVLSLPSSPFIPAINPSKPEIIPWTLGPYTPTECPSGQPETLRTALVRRSARVRHIRVVTVYITWHLLWRKQWTLTTGILVVVTIGVKACTFRIKRFHNGSCAVGVSLFTDHFLSGKGQRISTCVSTTETMNRISHHFYFQNHFNIGMSGNQIQICPKCSRECNELC